MLPEGLTVRASTDAAPIEEMTAAMDGETWFTSSEAKAAGPVDSIKDVEPASGPENKGGAGLKAAAGDRAPPAPGTLGLGRLIPPCHP
ncbi:hypothetical protein BKE38_01860 [Pseudoroseomonas deserti]|uniref:Uncharacterized protein n=2 Tax=Teichococcus deserti TaxID=1817963 RepID=A0A1V2H7Z4_9PROT|nr:hypothetical protein BKE38_01860 [Pseudoroseomonas deserti]